MLKLIIEDDQKQVKVVKLLRDEITIGRKEGNTIRLTDRNVSRNHARIIHKDGRFIIEDRKSYNGVFVNGKKIKNSQEFNPGDKIRIGDYILMIRVESEEKETDPFEEMKTVPLEQVDQSSLEQPTPASAEEEIPVTQAFKLGVMSTNLAGNVYHLTKKVMVIGRTPDNDIVLDHKSISRHHARIERNGDVYTIYDLDSSNGVRINGESYKKMDLRKGDIIDLGHVRIKFLAPDEDFSAAEELLAPQGGSRLGLILGAVAVAAAILLIGAYWMFSGSDKEAKKDESVAVEQYNQKVEEINRLITDKEWDRAEAEVTALLEVDGLPDRLKSELKKKKDEILWEKKNKSLLEEANRMEIKEAWKDMFEKASKIPDKSVYSEEARKIKEHAIRRLRDSYETQARAALVKGDCDSIRSLVDEFSKLSPPEEDKIKLSELLAECSKRKPVAVADQNPVPAEVPPAMAEPPQTPMVVMNVPKPVPPMAVQRPMRARPRPRPMTKKRASARTMAASSGGSCPSTKAIRQLVYGACRAHEKSKARRLFRRYRRCLTPRWINMLKKACGTQGVTL